ncbi:cytochrome C biogenesis protein CcdA [Salipiger aestuarii]|uniref:Cytochrome c-type biogenesis protein n=1 Tax=Salipiger aestuarii TaxID=568098 RepID=A0A327YJ30_9RHOB|nr:cytochrome c-type biogenesis protein [Salipiger aestuarii]EIE52273.1 cytochrome C biogenesis protein [Citreicella sp. 357]KAA8609072.1 cytochrome C biogenesis protein CcdA [Salipiger aestuarii]KAA8614273.1 cytochrome C biogenesis protein CcdA [Salipiger aestuarii]KAB2542763.1 cytochrome C biogenesis protein CcdA [Salipiger aestuarii]RAK20297.1 cytochrome c-type biogenesis protein CcmH [Salipiger aestuarii]
MKRFLVILLFLCGPALAVQPDEVLPDPAQEARAREISQGLRCLVCQNENIDDSNASLARDLRLLVRERITAGDSDDEVVAYLVDRYGEFVLLRPTTSGWNWLLWAAGPLLFLFAMGLGGVYIRSRSRAEAPSEAVLSPEEQARLRDILDDNR